MAQTNRTTVIANSKPGSLAYQVALFAKVRQPVVISVTATGPIRLVPGTIWVAPCHVALQRMQALHFRAVKSMRGKRRVTVTGANSAFRGYSNAVVAALGQIAVVGPAAHRSLLIAMIEFVESRGSLAGIEGVYLSTVLACQRSGQLALASRGTRVWRETGLPEAIGGGARMVPVFDVAHGQLNLVGKDALVQLDGSLGRDLGGPDVGGFGGGFGGLAGWGDGLGGFGGAPGVGLGGLIGSALGGGGIADSPAADGATIGGALGAGAGAAIGGFVADAGGTAAGAATGAAIGGAVGGVVGLFVGWLGARTSLPGTSRVPVETRLERSARPCLTVASVGIRLARHRELSPVVNRVINPAVSPVVNRVINPAVSPVVNRVISPAVNRVASPAVNQVTSPGANPAVTVPAP